LAVFMIRPGGKMQERLLGTLTWLYIADVLPSIHGTPSVERPWNDRFAAWNDWHCEIAWSGVEGKVWVQNWSVFSVAIALDMSPRPISLNAAVLLVPSVMSANRVLLTG
jgi:hypothetical protein